jgi:SAM-dependent methyltransferase
MATVNRFDDLVNAPAEDRKQIAERLYDETYAKRLRQFFKAPARVRLKKIALYKQIIGTGNRCILELGCGSGDLTYALVDSAQKIVATDISTNALELAGKRKELWSLESDKIEKIEFKPMSAVQLDFPDATFHGVISTSMIGNYLIWCPNGLGHHEGRGGHLTMLSYKEWTEKLGRAGFHRFRSTLTSCLPFVDTRWKIAVETILSRLRIKLLWSHLGVRNVLLVATK